MHRLDDIVEATEALRTDDGPVVAGQRLAVAENSASGAFFRPHNFNSFVRASAFRLVERPVQPGGCAPPVYQAI